MLETIAIFSVILLIAMLSEPLAKRIKLPFSTFLVMLGFIGSEIIIILGFDTGLRAEDFVSLILYLLVPIIVFESAFNANLKPLLKNIAAILFLAIPAMLVASLITGLLIFFLINDEINFPLTSALIAGVILSATDPVAVVAIFKKLGAPERLNALLEGESLFNDATAIVAYSLLVAVSLNPTESLSVTAVSLEFIRIFLGGALVGLLLGFSFKRLYQYATSAHTYTLLGIITAVLSFYIAEHLLEVSGVVAVLTSGLLLGYYYRSTDTHEKNFSAEFWKLNAYIANAILFVLVGVTVTFAMFSNQWLAISIGIVAAIIARVLTIYGLLSAFSYLPKVDKVSTAYKNVLMWGGLRGAVSLALALSIPAQIDGWYTIQSIVYGVVIFTLFIQAPLIDKLVRKTLNK